MYMTILYTIMTLTVGEADIKGMDAEFISYPSLYLQRFRYE